MPKPRMHLNASAPAAYEEPDDDVRDADPSVELVGGEGVHILYSIQTAAYLAFGITFGDLYMSTGMQVVKQHLTIRRFPARPSSR